MAYARRATPTSEIVPVEEIAGSSVLVYPDFLPPPDVALASAYTATGLRSRTAKVLVAR